MAAILEINGFFENDTGKSPFYLKISEPIRSETGKDYYCNVHAPSLFKEDKRIYGVNEDQARSLSLKFVKQMLVGKRLVDGTGKPIEGFGK
jgi:hypothetical protein